MGNLSNAFEKLRGGVKGTLLEAFREAVIEAGDRLIDRTPILTGQAKGSWQSTINQPTAGEVPERDAAGAKAELRAMAARLTLEDVAILQSNLDYIVRLELGWSKQAPAGMIRLTQKELRQIFRDALIKVKARRG